MKTRILIGLIAVCTLFISQSSRADSFTFDFVKAIDDGGYDGTITMFGDYNHNLADTGGTATKERGGDKLTWFQSGLTTDLTLTVTAAGDDFVYLDKNWRGHGPGGLGVTSKLTNPGNQAAPSSDDNVSFDEILELDFGVNVVWDLGATVFRDDTHNKYTNDLAGLPDGMQVQVDGQGWMRIDELYGNNTLGLTGKFFEFQTIDDPDLDKQFYIDTIAVDTIATPEPATVALLGIGIVGMAGAEARRRRKKKGSANS